MLNKKNNFEKELRSKKNDHQINLVEIIAKHYEKYAIPFFYAKWIIPTVIIITAIYIYFQGTDNNIRYQHFKEIFVFVIYTTLGGILESTFNTGTRIKKFFYR
jgi:hypothetical protein